MNSQRFASMSRLRLALMVLAGAAGLFGQTPPSPTAYVSSKAGDLFLVNVANGSIAATIPLAGSPSGIALAPGGELLYAAQSSANSVAVINTGSNTVVATIPVGTMPLALAITPNGQTAYVVNVGSSSVSAISTAMDAVVATVHIGGYPTAIAVTPDGSRAFVVSPTSGTISVIGTASNTVIATWSATLGAHALALSPDGATLYLASPVTNEITVYDTTTGNLLNTIGGLSYPDSIVVAPSGSTLYVSNLTGSSVSAISTTSFETVATVKVNAYPTSVAISEDGSEVYVVSAYSNSFSVISTAQNSVVTTVTSLASPFSVAVPPVANPAPNLCTAAPTGLPPLAGVPGISLPVLPQTCYQPPFPTTTSTVTVAANSGSDLQSKLSAAVCGEKIIVPANNTYVSSGTFIYGPTNQIAFGWQPSFAVNVAIQFVDPAYHLQVVHAAGTTGLTMPTWNDSGGTTTDGTAVWTDTGILPQYCPTNPVLLVSSNIADLPYGQTISQSAAPANVPTLKCNSPSCAALSISDGVQGLYTAGIEFTFGTGASQVYPIIGMAGYTPEAYAIPKYITFDRVLVHPAPCSVTIGNCTFVQAGIDLNADYGTVIYSQVYGIINTGQDTAGIATNNNSGPLLIAANYIESSGPNLYFTSQYDPVTASGTVTTSGTTVTWASGDQFDTSSVNAWPGIPFTIGSGSCTPSPCTVQSVQSATSLTLTSSAGTQSSPVPYSTTFYGYEWPYGQPSLPAPSDATVRLNHFKKQASWRNNPVGYTGVVNTSGTTATLVSGSQFNPAWGAGGIYVVINGKNYIVTTPATATSITLTTSPGTLTNANYTEGCIPSIQWNCWDVKDEFEVKNGQRILVDSNLFDTTFSEAQQGFFIWNTGIVPAPTVHGNDAIIQNNLFMHGPFWGDPPGYSGSGPQRTNNARVLIRNNVAIDVSGLTWGGNGYLSTVQNTQYLTFDHNTILNTPTYSTNPFSMFFVDAPPHSNTNFAWTNSFQYGQPFADSDNAGMTMADWPNNGVPVTIAGVVNVGDYFAYAGGGSPRYPSGMTSLSSPTNSCQTEGKNYATCWPLDWALVGFTDFTCGGQGVGCANISNTNIGGLALSSGSAYHNAASDGTDIGANISAVMAAVSAIIW
jgi:YVTN family beta-propeller protein